MFLRNLEGGLLMPRDTSLTGQERFFDDDDLIVSKTDLKGRITYCNPLFLSLAGYSEKELLLQPHSIIRHPEMPRSVFKLLWDTIGSGKEIFAYVVNRSRNGDHYWVNAHVTPSFDATGQIVAYHSNRRTPNRSILEDKIVPLYASILAEEQKHSDRKAGMQAGHDMLVSMLKGHGVEYDEFVATL